MNRAGALLVLLGLVLPGAPAIAASPSPSTPRMTPGSADTGWPAHYPRFRLEEYGVSAAALAGITALTWLVPQPPSGFKGEWFVDEAFRNTFRIKDSATRQSVATASDILQSSLILVPLVVDIGVGALLLERDLDLALQMALIDAEALLLASSAIMLTKRTIGRVRPNVTACPDGNYACRSNPSRRAFISGHATAAFTAAGLSCVHHQHLKLFGGIGDDLMCAGMLTLASATSIFRVAADKHWATDTLAGSLTGLFTGYAVPYLLHYQGDSSWPGRYDSELDGSLSFALLGGLRSGPGPAAAAAGIEAAGRVLWSRLRPLRLEAATQGRLVLDHDQSGVREYLAEGRIWFGPIGVGGAARYRVLTDPKTTSVGWQGGPTLSVGTFEETTPWLLSIRWLPAGAPPGPNISARLEWAPWPSVITSLEISPLAAHGDDGLRGALATVGAGGRLPW